MAPSLKLATQRIARIHPKVSNSTSVHKSQTPFDRPAHRQQLHQTRYLKHAPASRCLSKLQYGTEYSKECLHTTAGRSR